MLPFLRSLSDGNIHSLKELYQVLADEMQLDQARLEW
jgi:restriction system protein